MPPLFKLASGGQSNGAGRATNPQTWTHPTLTPQVFNGSGWVELTDSAYGAADGSFIPPLVTRIMGHTGRDLGIIPVAEGGTDITFWLPNENGWLNLHQKIEWAGGCNVLTFWHGESSAAGNMSRSTYAGHLGTFIDAVWDAFGAPVMPFKIQQCPAIPQGQIDAINLAIGDVWASHPHCLTGPDLSDLSAAAPDGDGTYHLTTDAMMAEVSLRVFNALVASSIVHRPTVGWRPI